LIGGKGATLPPIHNIIRGNIMNTSIVPESRDVNQLIKWLRSDLEAALSDTDSDVIAKYEHMFEILERHANNQ
jgi:hypothetical protein